MAGVLLVRAGRAIVSISLLVALVLTALVGSGRAEPPKKWTFDILSPTTGRGAAYAIDYVIGMNLAAKDINATGGINGKPVEMVFHDTQTDITQAVSIAKQLCEKGVQILIGPELSTEAESVFPVVNRLECPTLGPVPAKAGLTAASRPWTFVTCATATSLTPSGVNQFMEITKPKSAVVVIDKSDPSASLQGDLSVSTLRAKNVKVETIGVTKDDIEFSSVVVRIAALNPDVIVISTLDRPAMGVVEELTKQRLRKTPILVTQAGFTPALVRLGAEELEGVYIYSEFWAGNPNPRVQEFVRKFKEVRNGEMPTHFAALAYDAIYVVKSVLEKGHITGDPAKLKAERIAIRDGLQGLKNFPGLTGNITIASNGEPDKASYLLVFRKGVLAKEGK
jgi:branched-chain amino acid transport system substrate-binding protein